MLKIRQSCDQYRDPNVKDKTLFDRLIFNIGIPTPGEDGAQKENLKAPLDGITEPIASPHSNVPQTSSLDGASCLA